jgi:tryptophan synthase beta subunit
VLRHLGLLWNSPHKVYVASAAPSSNYTSILYYFYEPKKFYGEAAVFSFVCNVDIPMSRSLRYNKLCFVVNPEQEKKAMTSIEDTLNSYPRISLTRLPTPLHPLPHLSARLGLSVFVKRDDLTDLVFGGDKPRKLEYEVAQALAHDADTLVTCGSSQSNHARLTTAAARRVGMQCAVVLSRDRYQAFQGNLLTVYLMGAQVHLVESSDHWNLEQQAHDLCETLRSQGRTPHYIPVSGTTPHSCLGYVRCGLEIVGVIPVKKDHAVNPPFRPEVL